MTIVEEESNFDSYVADLMAQSEQRYANTMYQYMKTMKLKSIRAVFSEIRKRADHTLFFPDLGCTAGHFAMFYLVTKSKKVKDQEGKNSN